MKNHLSVQRRLLAVITALFILSGLVLVPATSKAASGTLIVLTQHSASLSAGQEFYLGAFVASGTLPTFKSSNSRVASVNTYGRVTAKQAGTCRITAKADGSEASCKVTVARTKITLNTKSVSLENGETFKLQAATSNNSIPDFNSNKKSVAVVDSNGVITACKPGSAVISVKADKTTVTCRVTVKKPRIKLNHIYAKLFRYQQIQLTADVSSGIQPTWKSNRSSVATVNDSGLVCAQKHGTAIITAKADGVSKTCEIEVESPSIKLSATSITMKVGQKRTLDYTVSSGNAPLIKSSKPNVVQTDQLGNLTARSAGTAVISFTEDGTRETCTVKVKKS